MAHGETTAERSSRTAETIAVLGAGGTMGFAMARNIARAGIAVRARRLGQGVGARGDDDFSATYLTSAAEHVA